MDRPRIEEFKRLCGIDTPFWGMADCDVVALCDYALALEGSLRDLLLQVADMPVNPREIERLRAALENLANACDVVGVAFFDTDSMDPAVGDMQRATQAARNLLKTI